MLRKVDSQKNPADVVLNLNKNGALRYGGMGYRAEARGEGEGILMGFCLIEHSKRIANSFIDEDCLWPHRGVGPPPSIRAVSSKAVEPHRLHNKGPKAIGKSFRTPGGVLL